MHVNQVEVSYRNLQTVKWEPGNLCHYSIYWQKCLHLCYIFKARGLFDKNECFLFFYIFMSFCIIDHLEKGGKSLGGQWPKKVIPSPPTAYRHNSDLNSISKTSPPLQILACDKFFDRLGIKHWSFTFLVHRRDKNKLKNSRANLNIQSEFEIKQNSFKRS